MVFWKSSAMGFRTEVTRSNQPLGIDERRSSRRSRVLNVRTFNRLMILALNLLFIAEVVIAAGTRL